MALDDNGIWWWHSLALPDGSVTPGEKSQDQLQAEWTAMALPDLRGKTVLDIGAWDGWFSFQAEKSGAARVVALDHFVWSLDLSKTPEQVAHRERCTAAGLDYVPWGPDSKYWDSVNLPGKRGFDFARNALRSRVEERVTDFSEATPESIGQFDVVFFLGVFYHLKEPLAPLRRLREITKSLAVIETAAIEVQNLEDRAMLQFTTGGEVNNDKTSWWFPNARAMKSLLETAGFSKTVTTHRTPIGPDGQYRLTVHAFP